jgi:hypothetical protein
MNKASHPGPQVLHRLPGRIRVHLPRWSGEAPEALEAHLRQVPGVRGARANSLTRNALVHFDPRTLAEADLLAVVGSFGAGPEAVPAAEPEPEPPEGLGWGDAPPPGGVLWTVLWRLLRHVLPDVLLCAAACAEPFGLPLVSLRRLQRGLDVLSWGSALAPLLAGPARAHRRGPVASPTWASAA